MLMRRGIFTFAIGLVISSASKIRQADDQSLLSVMKLTGYAFASPLSRSARDDRATGAVQSSEPDREIRRRRLKAQRPSA